jgi:hypothetical protein
MSYKDYPFDAQEVFISNKIVDGVQSVNTNFTYPEGYALAAGYDSPIGKAIDENINGEFSVERLIVNSEEILSGYFENGVPGGLKYDKDKAYIFETGLISSYRIEAEEGGIPKNMFSLQTWGKMDNNPSGHSINPSEYNIQVLSPGDIDVTVKSCVQGQSDFNSYSDLIKSISFNIDIKWEPINSLGSSTPQTFIPKSPTEILCEVEFEINDFKFPDFTTHLCSPVMKDVFIKMGKCSTGCDDKIIPLMEYKLPSCTVIEFNQYSSTDEVLMGVVSLKSTALTPSSMHLIF